MNYIFAVKESKIMDEDVIDLTLADKVVWDKTVNKITLPGGIRHDSVSSYPAAFGEITDAIKYRYSYLLTDKRYHRLLIANKYGIKTFGPVLNSPYSVAFTGKYIYVACYPSGTIEPSLITVLDSSENIFGHLYLDKQVNKSTFPMMYSTNPDYPENMPIEPEAVNLRIKKLSSKGSDIIIEFSNGETHSFDGDRPDNAMLEDIGWRYVYTQSKTITTSKPVHAYTLDNLTMLDCTNTSLMPSHMPTFQNNIGYKIENTGDNEIYIYGISNNRMNFSNIPSLLNSILHGSENERDKIHAIWNFVRSHINEGINWPECTFKDDGAFSPIRFINSMGSGDSTSFNGLFALLCQAAGISVRQGSLSQESHTAVRMLCDNQDVFVDASKGGLAPFIGSIYKDEHGEIRTYESLCEDASIIRNTGTKQSHEFASMIGYKDSWNNIWQAVYSDPYTMGYYLKPREIMSFTYDFNGSYTGTLRPHSNIVTGRKIAVLNNNPHARSFFELNNINMEENIFSCLQNGRAWFSSSCPFPITGILIDGYLYRGRLDITSDYSNEQFLYETKQEFSTYFGAMGSKSLKEAQNSVNIQFSASKARFRIRNVTLFFQANQTALCSLVAGQNDIEVEASKGRIKISHEYIYSTMPRPRQPQLKNVKQNSFTWTGYDGVEFEFLLSDKAQCSIPYGPVFHQLVNSNELYIDCQELLVANSTYYWKVRSRNRNGVFSPWSSVQKFTYNAPAKPILELQFVDNEIHLSWERDMDATSYEIYGSNEQSFTASKQDYPMYINRVDSVASSIMNPANYITSTKRSYIKFDMDKDWDKFYTHYRLISVGKKDSKSMSSDCVSIGYPLIQKNSILNYAYTNCPYSCHIQYIYDIGRMRYNTTVPKDRYTSYSDADKLQFSLTGPDWLQVREYDGYLHGHPRYIDMGENEFILTISNQYNKSSSLSFTIHVHEAV